MLDIFRRESSGVYFSSRGFVIVQQHGGKLQDFSCFPYPPALLSHVTGTEDIFQVFQNNMVELVAFMQKALRDSRVETNSVVVALPSKDLIIRFFEMPQIPRSEVVAGINFEMKKYVPFKVEDLSYDFQYRVRPRANILEVILCGMRREGLNRYQSLFKQLNLDVVACEPSLFSLFRFLAVRGKIAGNKSYVILEVDEDEADILIVDKGFPYFTRDIRLLGFGKGPGTERDTEGMLYRLVNEVRVSMDYFRRQFMKKDVDEMLILSRQGTPEWGEHFHRELGLKTQIVPAKEFFKGKDVPEDMIFDVFKACGASCRHLRSSLITLNLAKPEKFDAVQAVVSGLSSGLSGQSADQMLRNFISESRESLIRGAIIGAVLVAIGYGIGFSKLYPLEKELQTKTVVQPPFMPGLDLTSLETIEQSERDLISKKKAWTDAIDATKPQDILIQLPHLFPKGVWAVRIYFSSQNKYLELECASYHEERRQRLELMNEFLRRLKADEAFCKEYAHIELLSYREKDMGEGKSYLTFKIVCSTKTLKDDYGQGTY